MSLLKSIWEEGVLFPNRHSARRARAGPGEGPSARGPTSDNGRLSELSGDQDEWRGRVRERGRVVRPDHSERGFEVLVSRLPQLLYHGAGSQPDDARVAGRVAGQPPLSWRCDAGLCHANDRLRSLGINERRELPPQPPPRARKGQRELVPAPSTAGNYGRATPSLRFRPPGAPSLIRTPFRSPHPQHRGGRILLRP